MSEYFSYAQLISCTSIVDFQQSHKIDLEWTLSSTSQFRYDKLEIYRFIGNYMECVDENTVTENLPSKLICTITQNDDGNITKQLYFPSYITTTLQGALTADSNKFFTDDFSTLSDTRYDLDIFHNIPSVVDNKTVIDDISYTRRVLYYIIKTYIKGIVDSAPYLVTVSYADRRFVNHSSKSQVRHNYLHYEGDEIWSAFVADAAPADGAGGLSRTAVDINRMHLDATHAGPTGRGGSVWVSDRTSGKAMQYNLRDGSHQRTYSTGRTGRGFGIGIHTETGNCIAGPGDTDMSGPPNLYYMDTNKTTPDFLMSMSGQGKRCIYGIVPLYGYPDRMFITDYYNYPGGIYNITTRQYTPVGVLYGYAAASCPNGLGVQARHPIGGQGAVFVNPIDARFLYYTWPTAGAAYIGVDDYSQYPNSIVNAEPSRNDFSIRNDKEFNLHVPFNCTDAVNPGAITLNWYVPMNAGGSVASTSDIPGYDGENNLWKVHANHKVKTYRTAGDHFPDDDIDESTIYPIGGYSRYPQSTLNDWPYSNSNTREIEWFLTRNHGVSGYHSGSLVELDTPTLDKTVAVEWISGRTESAYDAWWYMVEQKMIRVYLTQGGSWVSKPYFSVFKSNGLVDINGRKWGMRINVTDIRADLGNPGTSLDDFYENYSSVWLPIVRTRINAWNNAFAKSTSYTGVVNRETLIANNQLGIYVHPFYSRATNCNTAGYYINPAYNGTETRTNILHYFSNLKYYSFGSPLVASLYMYSDFTGNILAGTVDSTPVNKTTIHPTTVNPTITATVDILAIAASGYQSNPYYQDTPSHCYAWKNTSSPSTTLRNAITGYDDFTVTFHISADMGAYLVSSVSLYTDDFMPGYLTDTNNTEVIQKDVSVDLNKPLAFGEVAEITYTYRSPSMNGLYYLPSGNSSVQEYLSPVGAKPSGKFSPRVEISYTNLYDYNLDISQCNTTTVSAEMNVTVLERWPEPKFFINATDNRHNRQNFFCNNTWGRSCPESYVTVETMFSACPVGYGGYSTYSRSVTVVDDIVTDVGSWSLIETYCNPYLWAWGVSGDAAFEAVVDIEAAYSDTTVAYVTTI